MGNNPPLLIVIPLISRLVRHHYIQLIFHRILTTDFNVLAAIQTILMFQVQTFMFHLPIPLSRGKETVQSPILYR
jgi:hypothetical protein